MKWNEIQKSKSSAIPLRVESLNQRKEKEKKKRKIEIERKRKRFIYSRIANVANGQILWNKFAYVQDTIKILFCVIFFSRLTGLFIRSFSLSLGSPLVLLACLFPAFSLGLALLFFLLLLLLNVMTLSFLEIIVYGHRLL